MSSVFDVVEVTTTGLWLGSIVFFSLFVAPLLFRVLAARDAASFVRALFPRYYMLGIVCGLILCPLTILRHDWRGLGCIVSLTLIDLYCRQFLTPRINEARDAEARQAEFDRMHRLSVQLNGVVMLGLIGFLVWTAWR